MQLTSKRQDATGRLSQRDDHHKGRQFFSRVSEATLGILGTKLSGVSAFRVVAMSRVVAGDVKATGRDRTVITKAGKRSFFSRVSEATLGTFPGRFCSAFGAKVDGVSVFRVV